MRCSEENPTNGRFWAKTSKISMYQSVRLCGQPKCIQLSGQVCGARAGAQNSPAPKCEALRRCLWRRCKDCLSFVIRQQCGKTLTCGKRIGKKRIGKKQSIEASEKVRASFQQSIGKKNKCNEICHEVLACFKVGIAESVAEPTAATLSQGVAGAVAEPVAEPAIACVHMCSAVACVGSSKLFAAVAAFDPKECFVGFAYKLREAKHFDCFKRRLQAMDDLRALLPRPNLESSWCLTT